ncbi:hypothetical protein BH23CHL5_BH23CHL5_08610 [soil metagenome]
MRSVANLNRRLMVMWVVALIMAPGVLVSFPERANALDPLAPPDVTAEAVYVFDATLDTVLYEKNADERRSPASLTKIATALVVLELVPDLNETMIVDQSDVLDPSDGESMVGLVADDILSFEQMLYGLLINSGNDVAYAVSRELGQRLLDQEGSSGDPRARFVEEMNRYARDLGLENTNFENAEGLYAPNHLTTAREFGLLTKLALEHDLIARIVSTSQTTIESFSAIPVTYYLQTTNKILGEDGVSGVKTGTTMQSGACLIASKASPAGSLIVTVVLGSDIEFTAEGIQDPDSDRRYSDTRALFSAIEQDFVWLSPGDESLLPGLNSEMQAWDVELSNANPIILRSNQVTNLRYVLQLGPPGAPQSEVGAVLLYDGSALVARRPVIQI